MPPDEPTTEPTTTEPAAVLPFAVPDDLTTVAEDDLRALLGQIGTHAAECAGLEPSAVTEETIAALRACRDLAVSVNAELTGRAEAQQLQQQRAGDAADLAAQIAATTAPAVQPAPEPVPVPEPTPAPAPSPAPDPQPTTTAFARRPAATPSVRQVATGTRQAPALPADVDRAVYASMTASADVPGFASGQRLERFADAGRALAARLDQYPTMSAGRAHATASRRPVTVYDPASPGRTLTMRHYSRHSAVQFRREFPPELRADGPDGYAVAEYVAGERRLPGGNLVQSARLAVQAGRSLTAAAGWCAPSETIYDLCELETLDGILDAPEMQTSRGGWQIPENGGPDFAAIYTGIGNAGDTHLTEAEVIADTAKVCTDIPCPDFDDVRLGVDYMCLTGGLLQRRGYPEIVARFGRGAMTALAHKINNGFISAIVTGSGAATTIPADPSGDDAISALLSAVDLAITDVKYRARMGFSTSLEVVLPMWVLTQMRAAATRRRGVNMVSVTDASIMDWFTERDAVPRFVYDWQDAYSGLASGPGGAAALTALPLTVDFLVYPAGTWVKAVQDVVNLDTIYDSTKLATNEYTAVFAEDGWAALKMCPISRRYTVPVDPSGVVGCCPTQVS